MDMKLQRLVSDYQTVVSRRFRQLRTELGFAAPESDVAWACNDLEQTGRLSDGARYFIHGYGCAITGATDSVDFDFGENGEIDGFAASSLWGFALASKKDYGFASAEEIAAAITRSAAEGELRFSGYILYYVQKKEANTSEPTRSAQFGSDRGAPPVN
jgi:hypothetical protein